MMISGSQAMVECLRKEGVDILFGYPGATIAPFYDSLSDAPDIRHVLARTEQGAGHAASGWARTSGKPGVCVVTSGPGATNLFTALATAYSDSIPLIAITGQVATYQLGRDVFQEIDTTGAAAPFTKYTYLVKSAKEIGRVFKEAFHIASTGRKGPVLIDMPMDVQKEMIEFHYPEEAHLRGYKPRYDGHPRQVQKVADAINAAKRPVICCGGGVHLSCAAQQVQRLCEEANLPLVSTMMGIGVLPPGHPAYYGMLGQSGIKTANTAIQESDLLLLIGARVGNRAIMQPSDLESSATIIHIDIDTAEIGKNMGTTIPLVGDASRVLAQLLTCKMAPDCTEWVDYLSAMREKEQAAYHARTALSGGIEPHAFVRTLCGALPENSVYVADVGQNQIWSAKNFCAKGRFLTTGGMGTMGYSIPAAIGAKLSAPDNVVLAVCGDGSFQMSMNELATMQQHGAPIKIVIINNGKLGMVREIQQFSYDDREYGIDLLQSPDFGGIAAAFGVTYEQISDTAAIDQAIANMLSSPEPFVLEVRVDAREVTV